MDLSQEHRLTVHLAGPEAGRSAPKLAATVRNISLRGCQLVFSKPEDRAGMKAGQVLMATLTVDDFPVPLQVEVIRLIGANEMAIRFKPPFPPELERLANFLEPRCLGLSMREIDASALQKVENKDLRWFQGVNDTHLFTWMDPTSKEIVQQQLVFLEKVVEWQAGAPLRTGNVKEGAGGSEAGYGWVKSELMEFDALPDSGLIHQAKTLLESARIDEKVKKAFLKNL